MTLLSACSGRSTSASTPPTPLRAIAALYVVAFHYTTRYHELYMHTDAPGLFVPRGLMGVQLFFVISGYLITSLLPDEELVAGVGQVHGHGRALESPGHQHDRGPEVAQLVEVPVPVEGGRGGPGDPRVVDEVGDLKSILGLLIPKALLLPL